MTTISRQAS